MSITRRTLLKTGTLAAAAAVIPRPLFVRFGRMREPVPPIEDPRLKALADRALEAARSAGASYANVRLTHTRTRSFPALVSQITDDESMVVGIEALVNGYWGFASSPVWSPDEMARLGREAVYQAKTNALGKPREVKLAPVASVPNGHWSMPVRIDPFEVSPFEVTDFLLSQFMYGGRMPRYEPTWKKVGNWCTANFIVQEWAFASTDGGFCTQRLYNTSGDLLPSLSLDGNRTFSRQVNVLTPAGLGWEYFIDDQIPLVRNQPLSELFRHVLEDLAEEAKLPDKAVEVGRYDTVFDAESLARLVGQTLGQATQLDRALGYEANAGQTSYLNDPLAMLGSYQTGAPSLTVTANRSDPGGAATVKWDDEGVMPDEFTLVKDGVLTDFQTTRESAGWIRDYYGKVNKSFRSHGCASAPSALFVPTGHTPNLTLKPGPELLDFDALVAGMSKGIAIRGASIDMDFQSLSGLGQGRVYEIKKGKRVATISGAGFLFRSPDLWKGLLTLGGHASTRRFGAIGKKGEPEQSTFHSVSAVPAVLQQLTLVDVLRKA